jgi:hypothetical protein
MAAGRVGQGSRRLGIAMLSGTVRADWASLTSFRQVVGRHKGGIGGEGRRLILGSGRRSVDRVWTEVQVDEEEREENDEAEVG